MQFISGGFLTFFVLIMVVYYCVKCKKRYLILLVANYIFYGWNNLSALLVLFSTTVWTYLGGRVLGKNKKKRWYALFFAVNIGVLVIYKYTDFFIINVNRCMSIVGIKEEFNLVNLIAPVGLSFYIFQSSSYLNDIYRKEMQAENNFLRYATFVSFFPTILSGPIQRSRDLLPQLKNIKNTSFEQARKGLLLFIWGVIEKLVVANKLSVVSTIVFENYLDYNGVFLIVAAVCFSLYIYSDFSAYSDMACGLANMLGINIRTNFRNPYLAENLSDFWNRWHMSLNIWFVENIYIPLGGNKKGIIRKYINIMIVFLFSGIWHGASWHFVIWGVLNGALRVMGEILTPLRKKVYSLLHIEYECFSMRFLRRAVVFATISITWVFFTVSSCSQSVNIIRGMFNINIVQFFDLELLEITGSAKDTLLLLVAVMFFVIVQNGRKEEGKSYAVFTSQPMIVQHVCIGTAIVICIIYACMGLATTNTQFIYFQF